MGRHVPRRAPDDGADIVAYGFLGAYLFDIQMLMRRFFQSDLKPSAYASAVLRVVVVLIIVVVIHQLPVFGDGSRQTKRSSRSSSACSRSSGCRR